MSVTAEANHGLHSMEADNEDLLRSCRIRQLAGKGLANPGLFTTTEIVTLCGAVMRHIENLDEHRVLRELRDVEGAFASP